MCSSRWDSGYAAVVKAKTPVYFVIGEDDEYYGSKPFKKAYRALHNRYKKQGLSEQEIDRLLVLDVKESDYFAGSGITYQHAGDICSAVTRRSWAGCSKMAAHQNKNNRKER